MCVNNTKPRMKQLIEQIREADIAYYRDDAPVMTDREYDKLFDELKQLEGETGLILSGSPTQKVSGEILDEHKEVQHTRPMLLAAKTKSVEELVQFAAGHNIVMSWKLDGLTLVLRYKNGEFVQAITRGREGIIGEDVTHSKLIAGVCSKIAGTLGLPVFMLRLLLVLFTLFVTAIPTIICYIIAGYALNKYGKASTQQSENHTDRTASE